MDLRHFQPDLRQAEIAVTKATDLKGYQGWVVKDAQGCGL